MDILSVFTKDRVQRAAYDDEEAKEMAEHLRLMMVWLLFDWEAQCLDTVARCCPICHEICLYNVPVDNRVLEGDTVCVSIQCISKAI